MLCLYFMIFSPDLILLLEFGSFYEAKNNLGYEKPGAEDKLFLALLEETLPFLALILTELEQS